MSLPLTPFRVTSTRALASYVFHFYSLHLHDQSLTVLQLRTERLITCQQSAPKWLASFLGGQEVSHVYETSYVDPSSKKVTMCSMNMTFSDLLSVRETVVYRPASANRTIFQQSAQITAFCGGWQKIKNSIEDFTVERFKQNAVKGREGFEMVLEMSRKVFAMERERQRLAIAIAA